MTSATDLAALPREDQYRLVYQGISEVARRCNGAITEDFVGFNGQDTHFGRRIAAVPFEAWTDDVKLEAARIANTYQGQILTYTGIEIQKLPVVREAMGKDTNRQARDDARDFERRAFHITASEDGTALEFRFKYNPALSDELKRHSMGTRWEPAPAKFWRVPVAQLPAFAAWVRDPQLKFRISPEAEAILDKIATTTVEAVRAAVEAPAKPHGYMLSHEIVFSFPYNPAQKDAVKAAGARWTGADKTWRIPADDPKAPAVVAAARQVGLTVATEVDVILGGAAKTAAVQLDRKATLLGASRVSRPQDVSPEFLALVAQAIKKAS